MKILLSTSIASVTSLALCASVASAQWTSNSALNTPVSVQPGDQAVTRAAAAGGGRTWIGWFDQRGGNYDVYVQLLDRDGNAVFAPNGLLVSNNPQSSSLVGWDLIADSQGNCVLAFTDTRAGSDLDVYAYRISQGGALLWGANGVTLSNNADYEPNPSIAELTDGSFVFVWGRMPSGTATGSIRAQRLDANGTPLYVAGDIALATGTATNEKPGFCTVVSDASGGYIVQWLRNTASFSSPRHIKAQRYDASGAAQWNGGSPVSVFDLGPVPIAHQPTLKSDGAGGAVLCWHYSSSFFDVFLQRLSPGGAELFPHNGVRASNEANRHKLDPAIAYLPASGDTIVVFDRREASQGQRGVGVQRISAAGALLWGSNGIELETVDLVTEGFERAVPFGDGAIVTYFQYPTFGGQGSNIIARRLDGNGADVWAPARVALETNLTPKDKPSLVIDDVGDARMAWDDERNDIGDVYAQNLHYDGTLGIPATNTALRYCISAPNSVGPGAVIGWTGSTAVALNNFGLTVSGATPLQSGIFFYGATQGGPTPFKNGYMCMTGSLIRFPLQTTDGNGAASRAVDLNALPPGGPITAGSSWSFQFWYRDPAGSPATTNTSDALRATFCL